MPLQEESETSLFIQFIVTGEIKSTQTDTFKKQKPGDVTVTEGRGRRGGGVTARFKGTIYYMKIERGDLRIRTASATMCSSLTKLIGRKLHECPIDNH